MTPITTERVMALARKHEAYPDAGKVVTLRGQGIVDFAQALLAEALLGSPQDLADATWSPVGGAAAVWTPMPLSWCCPEGKRRGFQVCPECAAISAAYSADMGVNATGGDGGAV